MYELVIELNDRQDPNDLSGDQLEEEIRERHPDLNIVERGIYVREEGELVIVVDGDEPEDKAKESLKKSLKNVEKVHRRNETWVHPRRRAMRAEATPARAEMYDLLDKGEWDNDDRDAVMRHLLRESLGE